MTTYEKKGFDAAMREILAPSEKAHVRRHVRALRAILLSSTHWLRYWLAVVRLVNRLDIGIFALIEAHAQQEALHEFHGAPPSTCPAFLVALGEDCPFEWALHHENKRRLLALSAKRRGAA